MKTPDDIELARGYSVARYRRLEAAKDKKAIAELLSRRFTERYLAPTLAKGNVKHGFTSMAIACLMVEALESFRQGWVHTKGERSKNAFCSFYDAHDQFYQFRGHAERFYYDVRCGILHQAETRGGWRIRRRGALFDGEGAVNATKFLRNLGCVLKAYCRDLVREDWNSDSWRKCRKKMDAVCKHASPL